MSLASASFTESDNLGTRQDTFSLATAYWMGSRPKMLRKDPFILFEFDKEEDARDALLELPCIHVASDSKKLICTEALYFGCYQVENSSQFEAIVCGDDLTFELWEQAKESFTKHGGRRRNDLEPTKRSSAPDSGQAKADEVEFIRQDVVGSGANAATYRTYRGPNAESAREFLKKNPVTQQFLYLVVETPEGNYGRDVKGIYKE